MSADTQYAYAVARIRAVEKKLLNKADIDRMVDAKSPEDALKTAAEAGYGTTDADTANPFEYEELLKEEMQKTYKLLREISPEPEVFDLFLYSNDYHNIKVILKSEFSAIADDSILLDTGSIPLDKLEVMIRDRNLAEMHPVMRAAVTETIDLFNRAGDPQVIDIILDRASFHSNERGCGAVREQLPDQAGRY